jgi:hypothetical protein
VSDQVLHLKETPSKNPAPDKSGAELAYQSPDGLVTFTAPQVEKFYVDLPGLRGKNIIGMMRHIDESFVARGKNAAERSFALREKLLNLHVAAILKANAEAVKKNGTGKPKEKRVWGDHFM